MDSKDLEALELPKVLAGLAARAAFSASRDLALSLSPTANLAEARRRQAETGEARRLLELRPELSVGGARDVRPRVGAAATLYGADAANGVIQIFTKKGVPGAIRWNGNVMSGYDDEPLGNFMHDL